MKCCLSQSVPLSAALFFSLTLWQYNVQHQRSADTDLFRMARCPVSSTPDMLMHPNKIKPDTLIDLGMHNWEMQGCTLFSATLTYSQNQLLLYEGRRWLKHVSWKSNGIFAWKCISSLFHSSGDLNEFSVMSHSSSVFGIACYLFCFHCWVDY